MSNQISTFNFENQSIRTIAINNEPWFIAKDLCDAINISNYRDAIDVSSQNFLHSFANYFA